MRELPLPPFAPAMLDSMRAIGYSFEAALADIVDNSVAAGATRVDIQFRTEPLPYVAVIDNGHGMTGSSSWKPCDTVGQGPRSTRSDHDLGRFGLGLKTASLSQCRRLTVSHQSSGLNERRDVGSRPRRKAERLGDRVLAARGQTGLPHVTELGPRSRRHGRPVASVRPCYRRRSRRTPALGRLVDLARDHFALAFHRFLSGDDGGAQALDRDQQPAPSRLGSVPVHEAKHPEAAG